jgi:hypothetical protein
MATVVLAALGAETVVDAASVVVASDEGEEVSPAVT